MRKICLVFALLLLAGCPKKTEPPTPTPTPTPTPSDRVAAVSKDHALYARVEGTSFKNTCAADGECKTGGCSSEVCSAEEGVNTTCEAPAEGFPSAGASCGCVATECIWYKGNGPAPADLPKQTQPCPQGKCAEGLKCLEYFGIAGPNGPKFTSCEIPCADKSATCPSGQTCTTIADGPGAVCRPPAQ